MSIRARRSRQSHRRLTLLVGAGLVLAGLGSPHSVLAADVTKPTVEAPIVRFRVGGQHSAPGGPARTAPVLITVAGSDTESGVDHFSVQRREVGHGWVWIGTDVHAAYRSTITQGHRYQFRVRAVDGAGNGSVWKTTPIVSLGIVGDNSSRIRYSGSWKHVGNDDATDDSLKASTTAGSIARLTFTGRAVAWVAPSGTTRGSAKVYIDGKLISTVDLHADIFPGDPDHAPPTTRLVQFTKTFSKIGTHQIAVKVLGTAGHPRVDVDAFLVIQ